MKKFVTIAGICCVLPLIILGVIWVVANNSPEQSAVDDLESLTLQGESIAIIGRDHVPEGTKVTSYNSNPPTSGDHWPAPAAWGFYEEVVADEQLVHNVEHGGIWISYNDIDKETASELRTLAEKYNQAVIATPRPANDARIAVASWGRLMKLDDFSKARIEDFIKANINNSPEKFASLEKAKVAPNLSAPDATFTTLDGRELTLSEFKGKKVMFWLLATWCPSCVAGAQVLAENNDNLGGLTIIALETYGNAGYPGPSMEEFAKRYAPQMLSAQNWLWGDASQEGTNTYNPRNYPDIFFLIDEMGVVRDIDGAPAATINKIIKFANE